MLFHTGFLRSICLLLRSNTPLHKCFLRAKGYHCHFCGLLPAVFLWKTFLFPQTIIFSPQPSIPSHHLLFPFCSLYCTKIGEEWAPEKLVCQVSCIAAAAKSRKGSGMGTANPVKQPSNYSELCQASLIIAWPSSASVNLSLINGHEDDLGSGPWSLWKGIPHLFWHLSHPAS